MMCAVLVLYGGTVSYAFDYHTHRTGAKGGCMTNDVLGGNWSLCVVGMVIVLRMHDV